MNQCIIIGNLTRAPEVRTVNTSEGEREVCQFTVAVNGRNNHADFFRVSAWDKLGRNCAQYLDKGRKVAVTGRVSVTAYNTRDGQAAASLEISAASVEFLTPKGTRGETVPESAQTPPDADGYVPVDDDELPF